jgi:L,D-peptidoglycan transpeptidase YkuD (ErfK/YbiS/YcfS/YnhG family)
MDLFVGGDSVARWGALRFRCAIGKGGRRLVKREGDGATPVGAWPMRGLLYRPDRLTPPATGLPSTAIGRTDGWCDAPSDAAYNQLVTLPYRASAERLWRRDPVYDLIVVLGYNDAPVEPGRGSAIFLHVARPGYRPTEGCVALARRDLLAVLAASDIGSRVIVEAVG